jgi:hypothetical protein
VRILFFWGTLPTHLISQVVEDFPVLERYVGHWPVTDLIKMRLKSTSTLQRRKIQIATEKSMRSKGKDVERA